MIIQIFDAVGRIVKIKVIEKDVYYSDSVDYPKYIPFNHLIRGKKALEKWKKRIEELKNEEDIADEITLDMKKFGFKQIRRETNVEIPMG